MNYKQKAEEILKNHALLQHVQEWIKDGWGLEGEISPEQMMAALLMEARTQDECVKTGDSHPLCPQYLRDVASMLFHICRDWKCNEN